jgi:hypothetical protein
MRDHGCYFIANDQNETIVDEIRRWMGKFNQNEIPKLISRMGQYFTQARVSINSCGCIDLIWLFSAIEE